MKDFKEFLADDPGDGSANELLIEDYDLIFAKMLDFMESLDIEQLDDEQILEYVDIFESFGPDETEEDLLEAVTIKVKTDKGDVDIKGNDTIEYEHKPGVVRIGMAGTVLKKGTKFKKGGKWMVVKSLKESVELDEAPPAKRVRRDPVQRRKAAREHRKVRAKKKIQGKRVRKTAKFKRFKKKQKRLGKLGKTASGKRKRKFINPSAGKITR